MCLCTQPHRRPAIVCARNPHHAACKPCRVSFQWLHVHTFWHRASMCEVLPLSTQASGSVPLVVSAAPLSTEKRPAKEKINASTVHSHEFVRSRVSHGSTHGSTHIVQRYALTY